MRWRGRRQSTNIRDVRGSSGGLGGGFGRGGFGGGFGRGPAVRRAGGGGIGLIVVVLIVAWLFGINPLALLGGGDFSGPAQQSDQAAQPGVDDEMRDFVATVLADTEDTWSQIFEAEGEDYREPTLTIFSGSYPSACGMGEAAIGPFYCPADEDIYIDLSFYDQLRQRFGAPGDFAQAYVLAHEVGHHVQNVLGTLTESQRLQQAAGSEAEANEISVRTELQADCYAGIWAHHTSQQGLLEEGDIEEAMRAAEAVGDDAIQSRTQGTVVPDSFTHGSSEQRATWFQRGLESGELGDCDTFSDAI